MPTAEDNEDLMGERERLMKYSAWRCDARFGRCDFVGHHCRFGFTFGNIYVTRLKGTDELQGIVPETCFALA